MNESSHAVPDGHTIETVELEISQIDLRYAHTRIMTRESLVRLAASIEQWGQIMPVITVSPCVLIDGYRRVAALKLCKRDTVLVEHWSCGEDRALLRVLSVGCGRRWDVVEQAALIRELTCCHRMSQAEVARLLGRDPSWVARRLGLLEALPEPVLERIRSGRLSSWAASRVLAPLARANADHAAALSEWISRMHVSTRDLADFFDHYKSAAALTRERMVAEPSLFLKAMRTQKEKKEAERLRAGPEGKWLSDLSGVVTTLRRIKRQSKALLHLVFNDQDFVLAILGEAAGLIRTLDCEIRSMDDKERTERGSSHPLPKGNGNPPDQLGTEGIEEYRPQGPARQGQEAGEPAIEVAGRIPCCLRGLQEVQGECGQGP
jgi:ParB-like chromosome segregation protein Spo0J